MEAMKEQKILKPFQKFANIESLSGVMLFSATILALLWVNSPYSESYTALWQQKVGFQFAHFELIKPLVLWINDGLMAIFFFLIGLEIKREVMIGELNSIKKASFPLIAALGGMVIPMSIFLLLNKNAETISGWGIPMATDIAFSLAIIKLLGKRVPSSLKIFLIAFAIVDDLGAVLVIAIFYSNQLNLAYLSIALLLIVILFIFSYYRYYSKYFFLFIGIIIWYLFLKSGIHPTIAGVLMAFTVPVSRKIDERIFADKLKIFSQTFFNLADDKPFTLSKEQIECIDNLEELTENAQSPIQQLEHKLHNIVAYFIMPIFALANAGVMLRVDAAFDFPLIYNLSLSLVLGKLIGITLFSYTGLKLKLIELPDDISNWHLVGVSLLAGVGFTMSIFVANLAFHHSVYLDSAKIGILIGSIIAGILGYGVLRWKSSNSYDD